MDKCTCKGKRIDSGEWVEGSLCDGGDWKYIVYDEDFYVGEECGKPILKADRFFEVDPATVGQCTGLRDKSETLIFEGDILKWMRADIKNPETLCGVVKWRSDQWCVIYDFKYDRWWILSAVVDRLCEIIGNIHDNPELLQSA